MRELGNSPRGVSEGGVWGGGGGAPPPPPPTPRDDGVKVNYAKFGTLLADVKKVTGTKGDD
jgi:hypothetical protein